VTRKLTLPFLFLLAAACGGKGGTRPERAAAEHPADPGSGPYYCPTPDADGTWVFTDYAGREQRLLLGTLETWETGAGMGWYTNNSMCTYCDHLERACSGVSLEAQSFADDFLCDAANSGLSASELAEAQAALDACKISCLAIQTPLYTAKPVPADLIPDGGRCGSLFALHMVAGPFDTVPFAPNESWGGVIGQNWIPYDAYTAGWEGIAFWGRAAPGSRRALRVTLTDSNTDPKSPTADCLSVHSTDHPEVGCDNFGFMVELSPDWQFFKIPFSEMRQGGWGRPAPYLNTAALYSMGFSYDVGLWDFWIDTVYFYRLESASN